MNTHANFTGIFCPKCGKPQPYFIRFKKGSRKVQCPSCKSVFDASKYVIPREYILQLWKLSPEQRQLILASTANTQAPSISPASIMMFNGGGNKVEIEDEGEEIVISQKSGEIEEDKTSVDSSTASEPTKTKISYEQSDVKVEEVKPMSEQSVQNVANVENSVKPVNNVPNVSTFGNVGNVGGVNNVNSSVPNSVNAMNQIPQPPPSPPFPQPVPHGQPPMMPPSPPSYPSYPGYPHGQPGYPGVPPLSPPPPQRMPPHPAPELPHPPEPFRRRTTAEIVEQVLSAYGVPEDLKRWVVNIAYQYDEAGTGLDPQTLNYILYVFTNGGRKGLNIAGIITIVDAYAREYYKEMFKDVEFNPLIFTWPYAQVMQNPVFFGLLGAMKELTQLTQQLSQKVSMLEAELRNREGHGYTPPPPEFYQLLTELRNVVEKLGELKQRLSSGGVNEQAVSDLRNYVDTMTSLVKAMFDTTKAYFEAVQSAAKAASSTLFGYNQDEFKFLDRVIGVIERKNVIDKVSDAVTRVIVAAKLAERGKIPPEMVTKMTEEATEIGISEGKVTDMLPSGKSTRSEEKLSSSKVFYERPPSDLMKGQKAKSSRIAELIEQMGGEVE